ncbi:short-chain dehydrogenase/reductase SDR [Catenovulum agarivorans DS-2]|uniref:Short-chain dehydrogenase/reductase SDR n=1 Tax=Catenovulum agarivorans DS-2 TaxID=1328313 RepID=W7QG58_9ALTE|nr:SDR family oxidoreductase [Catenovulum agarivorans]EWH11924.1 short-chain dehydrogenase/reductase SDR [Catenovulum agarivorans DS-2]
MKTVLITGANRGIGLQFTKQYAEAGYTVFATTRTPLESAELNALANKLGNIKVLSLDITDEKQIAGIKSMLNGQAIDILIANAGYYGPKDETSQFGQLDQVEWLKTLHINTIAPLKFAEALIDNLLLGNERKIAFLSSKMGSMTDNGSGGSYIYRSSKAALNAATKSLAIDLAEYDVKVVALHPGWVLTDMGGPNALINSETSVKGMRSVINKLTEKTSGSFVAYDGQPIPW